jgi:hypothetical protein
VRKIQTSNFKHQRNFNQQAPKLAGYVRSLDLEVSLKFDV